MKLFIDTETTGFPKPKEPLDHPDQPNLVQLAAILMTADQAEIGTINVIIDNPDCIIPDQLTAIHGISTDIAKNYGVSPHSALVLLNEFINISDEVIAHNIDFDSLIIEIAIAKLYRKKTFIDWPTKYCTMKSAKDIPGMPLNHAGNKKFPKLREAYRYAFGEGFTNAHNALADCRAMMRLYWWLREQGR